MGEARVPRPLRLALLGGGLASAVGYVHRTAAQLDGRWVVTGGILSRDPERNLRTADAWGIPAPGLCDSLESLVSRRSEFDAVAVLTPTPDHAGALVTLLEAGIPVICEKAITTSAAESSAIDALRRERGGFLVSTLNYTGYPMLRELRARIRRGDLGRILRIDVRMPQETFLLRPGSFPDDVQVWRRRDYDLPTIALDLGVHTVEIARFLHPSDIRAVAADSASFGDLGVTDDVQALVRYLDGSIGSFWFSKVALGARNGLAVDVYGEDASSSWLQEQPDVLHLRHRDRSIEIVDRGSATLLEAGCARYARFKAGHPTGFIEAFANLYSDIADALLEWRSGHPESTSAQGFVADSAIAHRGMLVLDAIRRAVDSAGWVDVEEHPS